MQPNDLPIICLPLELSDKSAAKLIEFLYELADGLERHYAGQLMRYTRLRSTPRQRSTNTHPQEPDPPF